MLTTRWNGATAVVNNILYAIGGGNPSGTLSVVEAYDPTSNSWTTKSPLPTATSSIYPTVENGIIYITGGSNSNGRLTTLLSYNPANDTWSTLAPMKVGKSEPALALLGSTIVAAGGLLGDNTTATTDTEGYNAATNTWTTLTSMPTARQEGCFESIGDQIYFTSGNGESSNDS
jgi:kelch-like protein 18